jgi:leucyl-tRNA synthetase
VDGRLRKCPNRLYNVQNPDELVEKYGADTLRLYEMFLGPLEQSKPWDTNGIEGVFRFIKKYWRLFHNEQGNFHWDDSAANENELKVLHKTIKKIQEDIERFSFNTAVSQFMICVNELSDLKCNKREILEPLNILLSSFAPHIAEEIWQLAGHEDSVTQASFPVFEEKYLKEDSFDYPVSFNGKMRFKAAFPLDKSQDEIAKEVIELEEASQMDRRKNCSQSDCGKRPNY